MKSRNKKIYTLFYNFIIGLFTLMMIGILFINLFLANKPNRVKTRVFLLSNVKLLTISLILFLVIVLFYMKIIRKYVNKLTKKQCNILLFVYFIMTFIMQIFIIKKIFFLSGWDVGHLRGATDQVVQGLKFNSGNGYNRYFSLYPNNVFLLFVFTVISKFAHIINVDSHLLLSIVGALSVNISIILLIKMIGTITKNKNLCVLGVFISTIFIMFTPWIVIPYSDTYAMFFTTSVLYVYLNKDNFNKSLSIFLMTLLAFIGYKIKPTVIIVLIAIVLIEVWKMIFKVKKIDFKSVFKIAIPLLASLVLFGAIGSVSNSYLEYKKNTDEEIPLTHFLMMGMNPIARGGYSQEDVDYTQSHKGLDNKKQANIKVIKKRLNEYGISGYCQLMIDKSLRNYNDGSFAWGGEGSFYLELSEENGRIATFLRNVYYNEGKYYHYFESSLQGIWLLILLLNIFSLGRIKDYKLLAIPLGLIGITVFLLLFESRARYLLLYAPYYIILAVMGYNNVLKIMNHYIKKFQVNKIN